MAVRTNSCRPEWCGEDSAAGWCSFIRQFDLYQVDVPDAQMEAFLPNVLSDSIRRDIFSDPHEPLTNEDIVAFVRRRFPPEDAPESPGGSSTSSSSSNSPRQSSGCAVDANVAPNVWSAGPNVWAGHRGRADPDAGSQVSLQEAVSSL
jgi:hypothetical protein